MKRMIGIRERIARDRKAIRRMAIVYARIALGVGFLSAVADRFGLWGTPGTRNVAWGDFAHFLRYTATVNPLMPEGLIPPLGWIVTGCEIVLGVALVAGVAVRAVAFLSGVLLLAFAIGMTIGTGSKTALDASVFAASACAFLLGLSLEQEITDGSTARSAKT